jgi:THO complex subunit 2
LELTLILHTSLLTINTYIQYNTLHYTTLQTEDGVHVSQWLQSLEAFAGEFYKGRPFVEFRGLVFYLMRRLKDGNVMELGMLRTLLEVAGGYSFADYSPAASLNEVQLDGRSGSVTLKRETMSFGIVEKTNPIAANRIRSVLQKDGLGVSMLILIAQARDRIIFDSTKGAFKEVKLVGNLYDTCQVVMSILLEFLTDDDGKQGDGNHLSTLVSMYSKFLPSIEDLQSIYGLDMATVWLLCRPSVKTALQMDSESLQTSCLKRFELTEDVRKSYSDSLPESVWSLLTPKLFEFFYLNNMSDIYCPEGLLLSEINRIEKEVTRIKGLKSPAKNESDELERLTAVSKQLDNDMKHQKERVESTLNDLNDEKVNFFASEEISREAAKAFLIYCIYPRATQSPDDAMYSSAVAFRLHKIWTPGFSIMHYLDELISVVSGALFGVTEAEAANLAILLCQTLKVVNQWRHEDGLYDKEVLGKPGSSMENNEDGETTVGPVSHKDFIQLYNKWQYSLGAALIGCLKSAEYIHTRTGLVVLSRLVDIFPTGPSLGNKLLQVLEPLQDESSSRPDIRASASAYGMMLAKARDDGKWVEEDENAAKERAEKEKEAAEERKKRIEKSFRELARDSEKITAQIGTDDRRDRPRGGPARDNHHNDRRPDSGRQAPGARDNNSSNRSGSDFTRMESGEVNGRDRDRRTGRDNDDDRRRDGGGGGRDDDKWRRDGPPQRSSKRSRDSSPIDDRDSERSNLKRPRTEEYNYSSRQGGNSRSPEPSSTRNGRPSRRGNNSRR